MRPLVFLVLAVSFLSIGFPRSLRGEIYRWVDSEGIIHYANRRSTESPKKSTPLGAKTVKGKDSRSENAPKAEAARGPVVEHIKELQSEIEKLQGSGGGR